ncbi:MAG: hypothetical protein AB1807_22605 [Pseudomonadota bacterium]
MNTFYRKYRNRIQYLWLRFRIHQKINEIHYIALQSAADRLREQTLLTDIRRLKDRLGDDSSQITQLSSPGHR